MKNRVLIFLALSLTLQAVNVFSQTFTTADYRKAAWMTTRFYGAQRSTDSTKTPTNWLIMNHGVGFDFYSDSDNGYDLSGGWFDCGDNVKFGQTQYYSAYMLLKGYNLWPAGYTDYYSQNYAGYNAAQDFSWEGAHHDPDGIPDILNEVKFATDYFIRCTRNSTTFYYQVGDGAADHKLWITTVKKALETTANGGSPRNVYKNPNDASMASFCGATLALMSIEYRKFNNAYADTCLAHALFAYNYAKAHPATAPDANGGSFYGANAKWQDDFACLCTELYYATKEEKYKTEALSFVSNLSNHNYCFGYNNNDDIAAFNLATLGSSEAASLLNNFATMYKTNVDANGLFKGGNATWGPLRYNANAAFIVALNNIINKVSGVDPFIYKQLDFILGNNTIKTPTVNSNLSFIVGFGKNSVQYPHHRNVYLDDNNVGNNVVLTIPKRNAQFGYLAGGVRSGTYNDARSSYEVAEGGIDYSACVVGSLAFVLSQTANAKPDTMYITSKPFSVSVSNSWPISLKFEPANSYTDVKWISRDTKIATVEYNGNVNGIALGSTYIVAESTDGKFIDSTLCTVSIINVTGVSVAPLNLVVGKSGQLNAILTPANASNNKVTWESSDADVATVSETGIVTAYSIGNTTITVTTDDGSFKATCIVTVSANPNSINAKYTSLKPIIDGTINEPMWTLEKNIAKVASGSKNNTETFGLIWDSTNLYIAVNVIDATITTSNANSWDNDAIELYFDMNHNAGAYDASDRQWIKIVNSSNIWQKIGSGSGAVTSGSKVISATQINNNGYSLEFAIPWTLLGITPNSTSLYGFDIAVDDCDGTTTRGNQITWVGTGDNYQDLSNVGLLQLSTDTATTPSSIITKTSVSIFPNPAMQNIHIKLPNALKCNVSLIDNVGRIICQQTGQDSIEFDCSQIQAGVYYISIENNKEIITQPVMIKK